GRKDAARRRALRMVPVWVVVLDPGTSAAEPLGFVVPQFLRRALGRIRRADRQSLPLARKAWADTTWSATPSAQSGQDPNALLRAQQWSRATVAQPRAECRAAENRRDRTWRGHNRGLRPARRLHALL